MAECSIGIALCGLPQVDNDEMNDTKLQPTYLYERESNSDERDEREKGYESYQNVMMVMIMISGT